MGSPFFYILSLLCGRLLRGERFRPNEIRYNCSKTDTAATVKKEGTVEGDEKGATDGVKEKDTIKVENNEVRLLYIVGHWSGF